MGFAYGYSATYVSTTSFTVSGDKTNTFHVGRRIRANCGNDGLKYGTVDTSSYSTPSTTITLKIGSDALTSNLEVVQVALVDVGDYGTIPYHDHSDLGQAGDSISPAQVNIGTGNDINLTGNDSDPASIRFSGSSYSTKMTTNGSGSIFYLFPLTNDVTALHISGNKVTDWTNIYATSTDWIEIKSEENSNKAFVYIQGDDAGSNSYISLQLDHSGTSDHWKWQMNGIGDGVGVTFNSHKSWDFGTNTAALDDAYADDWNNVADFFFLDNKDDLKVINEIKGSGTVDKRTGLELIDDDTLPEWILTKHKKTGEILYDPDGKPYISLKTFCSLLSGAIKQLDNKYEEHMREHHDSG